MSLTVTPVAVPATAIGTEAATSSDQSSISCGVLVVGLQA